MKKTVLIFGLIAGAILSLNLICFVAISYQTNDFHNAEIYGFGTMALAFSLIFVSVKNYRDKYCQGIISFGKAFKLGFFISLVASVMYLITWLIEYYVFIPDFMDRYSAYMISDVKAQGASPDEIQSTSTEMANYITMYKNPFFLVILTLTEVLPVGIIFALIAAIIMKRDFLSETSISKER